MEIAGRVVMIGVLIIVVQDRREKTAVRDQTIGAQGRKAARNQLVKTVDRVLITEDHVRKAVQDRREKTVDRVLITEAQGR